MTGKQEPFPFWLRIVTYSCCLLLTGVYTGLLELLLGGGVHSAVVIFAAALLAAATIALTLSWAAWFDRRNVKQREVRKAELEAEDVLYAGVQLRIHIEFPSKLTEQAAADVGAAMADYLSPQLLRLVQYAEDPVETDDPRVGPLHWDTAEIAMEGWRYVDQRVRKPTCETDQ